MMDYDDCEVKEITVPDLPLDLVELYRQECEWFKSMGGVSKDIVNEND